VRTAFHDAVARFGAATFARKGVVFPPSRTDASTSGTPVAKRACEVRDDTTLDSPRPIRFASRERHGATPARNAFAFGWNRLLGITGAMQHNT
jgi:hypothetical protein